MTLPIGPGSSGGGLNPKPSAANQKDSNARGTNTTATDASNTWASWTAIGLAIAAAILLVAYGMSAAFGGAESTGTTTTADNSETVSTGNVVEQKVIIEGYNFVPNSVDIPAGSQLILEIENTDTMQHDLKIGDIESGLIKPGETVTIDYGVFDTSIQGYCTVAGHKAMGMVFDVNVTGGASATGETAGGQAGMDHSASAASASAIGEVPSLAERTAPREGFEARDALLPPAPEGDVHELTLTATEEIMEVAPGREQMVWTFNSQVPAPTIRGKVGDTFRVTVRNEGTMDHSIDFHAGEVTPDKVMGAVAPGEELVYEFTAKRSGIWMYHCATSPMSLHIANGMAGMMIIDPPALSEVDHEFALAAHEIFLGEEQVGSDSARVDAGAYDLTGFNGYPNQYALDPLEVKTGDKVRIWVQNVGVDNPIAFHIVGELFETVFTEGTYTVRDATDTGAQVLPLLAAQGGFVEVTFDEPGTYTFVNHQMTDNEKGQNGQIVVTD